MRPAETKVKEKRSVVPVDCGEAIVLCSVIVPTYNESENIIPLLNALSKLADEVVVVDDNSPDGTGLMAKRFGGNVKTIIRPGKMGCNSAILQGVLAAKNDEVIVMDADFSHPPNLIPRMKEALNENDIVIARRTRAVGWGLTRHLVSNVGGILAQILFFRWRVPDPMSGFFGTRRSIVKKYKDAISPRGYKILFTILKHYVRDRGYSKITCVDYTFSERISGKSKMSIRVVMDYLKTLAKG